MRTATKQKYASRIDKIQPHVIYGSDEFEAAYGISEDVLASLRSDGLPCYTRGKHFIYYYNEVDDWIKKNLKLVVPSIKIK